MTNVPISPWFLLCTLARHRHLIVEMTRREVQGRYRGTVLGNLWALVQPLMMLGIYTFVFTQVFKARWNANPVGGEFDFAMNLFAGLIVFNLFAECLNRAPSAILAHANFVTRVVFPLEIIPCIQLLAALFQAGVNLLILLGAKLIVTGSIPLTFLLTPLPLLPLLLMVLGLSWFLSATGIYWRDLGQIMASLVTGLLFLSPVFYPASALPSKWRYFLEINPLTYPIELLRQLVLIGDPPSMATWLLYTAFASAIAWAGFVIFQKLRGGFADVL